MKFIITIILIVSAVIVFVFPARNLLDSVKPLELEQAALNEALNNAIRIRAERDKLNVRYSSFTLADADKLNKLLPSHVDSVRLILEVNNIARLHSMQLDNVKIDSVESGRQENTTSGQIVPVILASNKFASMTLSFSVKSDYHSFKDFLADLEKSLRIVDVTSLTFSVDTTNQNQNVYGVAIRTYWLNNAPKP